MARFRFGVIPVSAGCADATCMAQAVSQGECELRYDTLGGGIGLMVAEAIVAGSGVGLLLWSRKRDQAEWGVRARF